MRFQTLEQGWWVYKCGVTDDWTDYRSDSGGGAGPCSVRNSDVGDAVEVNGDLAGGIFAPDEWFSERIEV
jgi:hypothetical protein